MTKIAHVQPKGTPQMTVYYDQKAKQNPYRVYIEGYKWNPERGYAMPFKHERSRYADLASAVEEMLLYAGTHNEEGR